MRYLYDTLGRYAGTTEASDAPMSTDVAPPDPNPNYNWNGVRWVWAPNIRTVPVAPVAVDPTPAPKPMTRATRKNELAEIRYQHETGGIVVGGARIATDRQSQALITGAYAYSLLNPEALIDWKGADDTWTQVDAETIAGIAHAVATHVQACFTNERALSELIDAAETVEDLASIDLESGWPS